MPETMPVAARVDIVALGVPLTIEISGPLTAKVVPLVRSAWSRCLADPSADSPRESIRIATAPTEQIADICSDDADQILHTLSQVVTLRAIAAQAGKLMMFHAAGLCHPETGKAIALVAPSGTGKTTAAVHLGRRLGYLSDETVGFDRSLSIKAYAKPLSVIRGDGLKHQHSPDDLGLLAPGVHPTLTAVLLLTRDPSITAPGVDPIRTAAALPLLAEHTSSLGRIEQPLATLANCLESTGGLRRVTYRDVEDLDGIVDASLASVP